MHALAPGRLGALAVLLIAGKPILPAPSASVYFSPNGGCTDAIVRELGEAKATVHVMAYSFTSAPIAKALVDAHKRGVKVKAILDKSNQSSKYSSATFLHNHQIPVLMWDGSGYFHKKVIVIDGSTVIIGSFNFSKRAETSNAENLLVIKRHPMLAKKYLENFELHEGQSKPYTWKAEPAHPPRRADTRRAADGGWLYVTGTGEKYHRKTCWYAKRARRVSRAEARGRGLTPCKVCKPE